MSAEYICVSRHKNTSNIIDGYRLKDNNGSVMNVAASELKRLISSKKIQVTNLKLTSNNRIIMASQVERRRTNTVYASDEKANAAPAVQAYFTLKCAKYICKTSVNHRIKFIEYTGNLLNLVKKARLLGKEAYTFDGNLAILSDSEEIRVYGHNILMQSDCTNMFSGLTAQTLDFNNTNWCNTMTITRMFAHSRIGTLTFTGAKKCYPNIANEAFFDAYVGTGYFQAFSSEKLNDAEGMFRDFRTNTLNLKTFKAKQLENAENMFKGCIATKAVIGLTGENIFNTLDMFHSAMMQELDLTGFKPEINGIELENMFDGFIGHIKTDNEQLRASEDLRYHII